MKAQATKKAENKAIAVESTSVIDNHVFKFMGKDYTALDVATKAIAVQKKAEGYQADKSILGSLFVNMARTCKTASEFLGLCGAVEAKKSWKSEQNPQGSKSASETVPAWTQYKSNIKIAWTDFNITPQDYDSTGKLNKLLNEARKAKKDLKSADTGSEQLADTVNDAGLVDQRLAGILNKFTKLFASCDTDSQTIILEELISCYNGIVEGSTDDLTKELQAETHKEAKQAQASASH